LNNLTCVYIKNEKGTYSKWVVEEELDKHYNISLTQDRAIISALSKSKIYEIDGKFYSDHVKEIKERFKFAFASFRTIQF